MKTLKICLFMKQALNSIIKGEVKIKDVDYVVFMGKSRGNTLEEYLNREFKDNFSARLIVDSLLYQHKIVKISKEQRHYLRNKYDNVWIELPQRSFTRIINRGGLFWLR